MLEKTKLKTPLRSAVRVAVACTMRFVCAFLLSGASLRGVPLPLGLCFLAAAGGGLYGIFACAGTVLAACLLWTEETALGLSIAALLVLGTRMVFEGTEAAERRFFMPTAAAAAVALTGGAGLLMQQFDASAAALWTGQVLCAFGGTLLMRRCMGSLSKTFLLIFCGCLVFSASAYMPFGFHVGIFLAAVLTFLAAEQPSALPLAAVCGIALDLAAAMPLSATALLCLCAFFRALLSGRGRVLSALLCAALFFFAAVLTGWNGGMLFFSALPAAAAAAVLPGGAAQRAVRTARRDRPAVARMETAAALLAELGCELRAAMPETPQPDPSVIFDRAADRVCRNCVRFSACWGGESEAYDALSGAAEPMLARGAVLRDDFPVSFLSRCSHIEDLLAAINRELDSVLYRRQFRNRLAESRALLAEQYRMFSTYLCTSAAFFEEKPRAQNTCVPIVGVAVLGRRGSAISGDRGASFRAERHLHYVLLCDGMGSGADARRESTYAVRLLRALLTAGFQPADALQLLNSVYLLRDDGAFATVDLLRIDLSSQELTLYKWGSAPSYRKRGSEVEKICSVLPPPGLEGTGRAEAFSISVAAGEMLVLLSDGAESPEAETVIRAYSGHSPKELASCIVGQGEEDDRMAVVLKLQPLAAARREDAAHT
ncbi:MAG: SpoIIE family protein phosphatase [Oscillospiraceae bacterium]|nr:SpoIIE family protein phosphatase [Oscillospiraceae bacterium]